MATAKRDRQRINRQARLQAAQATQRKAHSRRRGLRIGALVGGALVVALLISLLAGGGGDTDTDDAADTAASTTTGDPAASSTTATAANGAFTYGTTACPAEGAAPVTTFTDAFQQCIDPAKTYTAVFDTTAGPITVQLDTSRTPGTTNNFVSLARSGYYSGSAFFRTDTSIGIIQGGGQTNSDTPGFTIPDEGGKFTYAPGDLVMARTGAPDSAGGQFFFAVDENTANLDGDGSYVTFGTVTEGLDVLERILATNLDNPASGLGGAPDPPVTVNAVTITES